MNAEWTAAAADTFTVFDVDAFFCWCLMMERESGYRWLGFSGDQDTDGIDA